MKCPRSSIVRCCTLLACCCLLLGSIQRSSKAGGLAEITLRVQPRMVKIYGAGGIRSLEAYQSGFLISAEGHVATVFSYVLDTDQLTVILDDGRRRTASLLGADPYTEIAVLKVEAEGLDHFDLSQRAPVFPGQRILSFSNLYGIATGNEPTSVLHGHVSAIAPLNARRGTYSIRYTGNVFVLDAITNNAGAAGGALTNHQGQLLGMLGKEVRDARNDTWLNYALPIDLVASVTSDILAGRLQPPPDTVAVAPAEAWDLRLLGLVLVPDVLPKTPAFVETVLPDSIAAKAGLQSDDLIVMINGALVPSRKDVEKKLRLIDQLDPVEMTILRDNELREIDLSESAP